MILSASHPRSRPEIGDQITQGEKPRKRPYLRKGVIDQGHLVSRRRKKVSDVVVLVSQIRLELSAADHGGTV